ncbi:MAG: hypothetical protein FWD27_04945 [Coriobacteriia bacterium]|nr:hypothetical protein [Coriobacteriia bacterium]
MNNSFVERTRQFWEWFGQHEERLSALLQDISGAGQADEIVETVRQGLSLISEDLLFNAGGDHEFTFSVFGDSTMLLLLPYITTALPEQYRNKWTFHPCMPPKQGQDFSINMNGVEVSSKNVMLSVSPHEAGSFADVRFYAKEWEGLDDEQACGAFFTLMDNVIGELLSVYCVGRVERAQEHESGMIPLTQLEDWLKANVCDNGELPDPAQRWSGYEAEPQNSDPRMDVFAGFSSCTPLIDGYYYNDSSAYDKFVGFGAKPVFLYYSYAGTTDDQKLVLDERNALIDRLEAEVLGISGSGQEIGLQLGAAVGQHNVYIDMLLFDEQAFFERIKPLMADFGHIVYCKEYTPAGQEFILS